MFRTTAHRRAAFRTAIVGVIAVAIAACGDDDEPSGNASTAATTTAASAATAAPAATAASGDDSRAGETIKIGYANNEGPGFSLPEFRIGGEVAIGYINANGGIDGAKIEVVECINDGSPEGSVNCANKFVDEGVAMYYAGIDIGADAALPILADAGIPYVSSHTWGPLQRTEPGAYALHAPAGAYSAGPMQAFHDMGLKKVTAFSSDTPTGHDFIENVATPLGAKLGLDVSGVFINTDTPDWNAAIQSAIANDAEGVWGQLQEGDCISLVKAARDASFDGKIIAGSCSQFIDELGEDSVGVYTQADQWIPDTVGDAPPEVQDQMKIYTDEMAAAGQEELTATFAESAFAVWMELRTILEGIEGPIDGAAVNTALSNAKDSPGFLGPNLHCGTAPWPTEPNNCSAGIMLLEIVDGADGPVRKAVTGEFIDLSTLVS
jgi:branched-chain amino acid transport system substrate-binding protein